MHEHQTGVGIDLQQDLDREDVVRTFKNPASGIVLMLQVLQEAPMKPIGFAVARVIQPTLI